MLINLASTLPDFKVVEAFWFTLEGQSVLFDGLLIGQVCRKVLDRHDVSVLHQIAPHLPLLAGTGREKCGIFPASGGPSLPKVSAKLSKAGWPRRRSFAMPRGNRKSLRKVSTPYQRVVMTADMISGFRASETQQFQRDATYNPSVRDSNDSERSRPDTRGKFNFLTAEAVVECAQNSAAMHEFVALLLPVIILSVIAAIVWLTAQHSRCENARGLQAWAIDLSANSPKRVLLSPILRL
jgi:hypothetical protein